MAEPIGVIQPPPNQRELIKEMRAISIAGHIKGQDPLKIYVKPRSYQDDPMSRFQSMKKFETDCERVKGQWFAPIAINGTTLSASCVMPSVENVTIEHASTRDKPYDDNFGSVTLKAKTGRISIIGFAGHYASREESGIHFIDEKSKDETYIEIDNRPSHLYEPELMPSKYYPRSIASTRVDFSEGKKCTLTAFATPAGIRLNPDWEPYRSIFHPKNARLFRPELATIESVRTTCSI